MKSEIQRTEQVRCPICGESDCAPWAYESGWHAVQCVQCNCVYLSPRPEISAISKAAETGMHPTQNGLRSMIESYKHNASKIYRSRLLDIFTKDELSRPSMRWLDIGAGFGQLMLALRSLLPPDAVIEGLEPSEHKRLVAARHGLCLHRGTLDEFVGDGYDVVSMCNVLSHLPNPKRSIGQIRALLRPGGRFVLLTGNLADCVAGDCPGPLNFPDHLVFVGRKTLYRLLTEAGFQVDTLEEYSAFFPEHQAVRLLKNVVKRLLGRETRRKNVGPFRDLLVRATLRG